MTSAPPVQGRYEPLTEPGVRKPARIGSIVAANGPVVRVRGLRGASVGEMVRVGPQRLLGEVIRLTGELATVQVYEETAGLRIGDGVAASGAPLQARLGPGLLGATYDGLQRPLGQLAADGRWALTPGLVGEPLDTARRWTFTPSRSPGEAVRAGDLLGSVQEGRFEHRILVPAGIAGELIRLDAGEWTVTDQIGAVRADDGSEEPLRLAQRWAIAQPRPLARREAPQRPLLTGQRVIDMLFPVARGGAAVIPGGFGTGKTVVEQSLARWSDADVVVYVGCGERGNEMAELLSTFPELADPRSGRPLLERTVLIANTSNMPVAAREASVHLGVTIGEYFRDQGYHVTLLADSTSRWAEALREIGGRLEELPGEEGYPAYLASRLAAFYERAGVGVALGTPTRTGSLTIVGAVSPPGGDFSEPVTQASLRLAGTFWGLDADLAHARHFPAISWTSSYSLYLPQLTAWYAAQVGDDWDALRTEATTLLARERQLLDIVQLVGPDALPDDDRVTLEAARLLREVVLRQHAFDPVDAARPPDEQIALLRAVLAAGSGLRAALAAGTSLPDALAEPLVEELRRAQAITGPETVTRLAELGSRLRGWETAP